MSKAKPSMPGYLWLCPNPNSIVAAKPEAAAPTNPFAGS